jgi:hypothetical protein
VYIQPRLEIRQSRGEKLAPERQVRTGDALVEADGARQRNPEHAEAVGHSDAQVDAERGGRHQPAVEAGFGNDALPVEQPRSRPESGRRLFDGRHFSFSSPFGSCALYCRDLFA